jgi:hypothetical protein
MHQARLQRERERERERRERERECVLCVCVCVCVCVCMCVGGLARTLCLSRSFSVDRIGHGARRGFFVFLSHVRYVVLRSCHDLHFGPVFCFQKPIFFTRTHRYLPVCHSTRWLLHSHSGVFMFGYSLLHVFSTWYCSKVTSLSSSVVAVQIA